MKGFLKCLGAVFALFGAIVGALVVFDKISNKNRIKGDYLECEIDDGEEVTFEE